MNDSRPDLVRFLLVDDVEENLTALEALLRRDGLEIIKARTGREALEHLLQHRIDLALLDVRMPEMDGFELAELMRGTDRTRRVPIIFLTAGAEDQQRRFRGYEAGAVDFLHKPVEAHVLKSKAHTFFELARERREVARQRDELTDASQKIARLLEESERTTQILRDTDQRKDEFLATLAHELRNPLSPLRSAIEILRAAPVGSEPAADAMAILDRQCTHLARLVDDLLDVARFNRGLIELRPHTQDLREIAESSMQDCRAFIESKQHQLTYSAPEAPVWVNADSIRLAQIISNLLNNAAKYTNPGGSIALQIRQEPNSAVLSVADTGMGIAPSVIDSIWDMFAQVRDTLEKSQGGLGIGLTLVKRLVELHHGTIVAESEGIGKGSRFVLQLPLAMPPQKPAQGNSDMNPTRQRRRILVIDDNVDAARTMEMLLRLSGHEVSIAFDGETGLEFAISNLPDLALVDIGLPKIDGFEVARRIRSHFGNEAIVLVALTGWGQEEDRAKSHAAGFDFHLTKPVAAQQLLKIIDEVRVN